LKNEKRGENMGAATAEARRHIGSGIGFTNNQPPSLSPIAMALKKRRSSGGGSGSRRRFIHQEETKKK
jgi:hypothetical protein